MTARVVPAKPLQRFDVLCLRRPRLEPVKVGRVAPLQAHDRHSDDSGLLLVFAVALLIGGDIFLLLARYYRLVFGGTIFQDEAQLLLRIRFLIYVTGIMDVRIIVSMLLTYTQYDESGTSTVGRYQNSGTCSVSVCL